MRPQRALAGNRAIASCGLSIALGCEQTFISSEGRLLERSFRLDYAQCRRVGFSAGSQRQSVRKVHHPPRCAPERRRCNPPFHCP